MFWLRNKKNLWYALLTKDLRLGHHRAQSQTIGFVTHRLKYVAQIQSLVGKKSSR